MEDFPIHIMTIVGARPQFIKASAVSKAIATTPGIEEFLVHTGQHYDASMSDVFFDELGIPSPALHLGVGSGNHGAQTGAMLSAIELAIIDQKPDKILLYGDTNSTLAGALAASKLHIPVAHVEAGLRSFNRMMPEEINRVLTDHISEVLFAPTNSAVINLKNEGISGDHVINCGDVMYDVALGMKKTAATHSNILGDIGVEQKNYIVATIHRAENTDDPERLRAIFDGLNRIGERLPIILPLHPRTRTRIDQFGIAPADTIHIIEPLGYLDMTALVSLARLIVTDSGGLQKEAFFHGVPCMTVRDETEWTELIVSGWNQLISPATADNIANEITKTLNSNLPSSPSSPYGDGNSSSIIVHQLLKS